MTDTDFRGILESRDFFNYVFSGELFVILNHVYNLLRTRLGFFFPCKSLRTRLSNSRNSEKVCSFSVLFKWHLIITHIITVVFRGLGYGYDFLGGEAKNCVPSIGLILSQV